MKTQRRNLLIVCLSASTLGGPAGAAILHKADNTTTLQTASSWTENVVPTSADTLVFDNTISSGPLNVSASYLQYAVGTFQFVNPAGNITLNWSGTSTAYQSNFVDMSASTVDVTFTGGSLRIESGTYNPTVAVASGRTFTLNSSLINRGNTKTFHFTGAGNVVINSDSGSGGASNFNVNGATVTMNNANSGWTYGVVSSGKLVLGNGAVLDTQRLTVNAANGLGFGSGVTSAILGGLEGSGGITLTNADNNGVALTIGGNNTSYTYSGALSGSGSLTKTGDGTQTMSGDSGTFAGGVSLNGGTLAIGHANGAGGSSNTITAAGGTTIAANSGVGSNNVSAAIALFGANANVTLTNANASGGFGGAITGSSSQVLTISQAGGQNVNLNASGQQLSGFSGTVAVPSGATLAFRATSLNNGGNNTTFDLSGGLTTRNHGSLALGALTGNGNISMGGSGSNNAKLNLSIGAKNLDTTYGGVINDADVANGKTVNLAKAGSGRLTLTGNQNYTGSTTINSGTLEIAGDGDINKTSSLVIGPGSTFRYNSSVAYTGGAITNNGGRITGTGTIGLTVDLGSTSDIISPGNSPGVQSYGVAQAWQSFTYEWETNNFTGTIAGTDFDQIAINGALDLTGASSGSYVLDLVSLTGANVAGNVQNFSEISRSWNILTASGGITGFNYSYWTIDTGGFASGPAWTGSWSLGVSGNNLVLNYTAIPEPSVILLGALGSLALFRRRR